MNETPSVQQAEVTSPSPTQEPVQEATQPALEPAPSNAPPAPPVMSREACAAELAARFPALFAVLAGESVRPIKLRVHADIQARAPGVFSRAALGAFFARHTTSTAYLKALTAAPHRFDLDGQPAGEIAQEHRQAAVQELARRKDVAMAKHRAQAGARRAHDSAWQAPATNPAASAREPVQTLRVEGDAGARPPLRPKPRSAPRFERRDAERQTGMPPKPRRPEGDRAHRGPANPHLQAHAQAGLAPVVIGDASQRERAALLHAYQNSPLSKANFCALKRITPQALDLALAQAEQERLARSKAT
jgi:ProP effector